MEIDWFTVIAQLINFTILAALLKRFLYDPIGRVLDEREAHLTATLADAEAERQAAVQERTQIREQVGHLQASRDQILDQAREEAAKERSLLLAEARRELDEKRRRWQAAVQQERMAFLGLVRKRVAEQVFSVSSKALRDLGNVSLEMAMAGALLKRLGEMPEEERSRLFQGDWNGIAQLRVCTSFDMSEENQNGLRHALCEIFSRDLDLSFDQNQELLCGIELRSESYVVSWTISEYLSELDGQVQILFDNPVVNGRV